MPGCRLLTSVLLEHVDVSGKSVVDVGCGTGVLVRWLRENGAEVVGVECNADSRTLALFADPDHPEAYVDGVGQDLPFDDTSADLVVFSRSLHHVPQPEMLNALREAHRVLGANGTLFVVEPLASGPWFEVTRVLDDETVVRQQAQKALLEVPAIGFDLVADDGFATDVTFESFAAYEEQLAGLDRERRAVLAERRGELAERFKTLATPCDAGHYFARPQVFKVFKKT